MFEEKFSFPIRYICSQGRIFYETYRYGWHRKSIGLKILTQDDQRLWVKITNHKSEQSVKNFIHRAILTNSIPKVKKPYIHNTALIRNNDIFWSVLYMDYIDSPIVNQNPYMESSHNPLSISEDFLFSLKNYLLNLGKVKSQSVAFRQDLINRRIKERCAKPIHTEIKTWGTVHGDLHWANITQDRTLLDWESWGRGPQAIDIAFLYAFSLLHSPLCKKISIIFSEIFATYEFKICLLFVCSELIRMVDLYDDYLPLYEDLLVLEKNIHGDIFS